MALEERNSAAAEECFFRFGPESSWQQLSGSRSDWQMGAIHWKSYRRGANIPQPDKTSSRAQAGAAGAAAPAKTRQRWHRLPEQVYRCIAENPGAILLETSRFDAANHRSYLFMNPVRRLIANHTEEIAPLLGQMDEARAQGQFVAGFISYECGAALNVSNACGGPSLSDLAASVSSSSTSTPLASSPSGEQLPLAWFGVYGAPHVFDHALGYFVGGDPDASGEQETRPSLEHQSLCPAPDQHPDQRPEQRLNLSAEQLVFGLSPDEYCARILAIKERIAAGDTYQVNFTDAVEFQTQCSAVSVYRSLLTGQSVAYGAWCNLSEWQILSFSPELFFRTEQSAAGRKIIVRPMKGTMRRGLDREEDAEAARRLQKDEKNRSEHVMIVDLMRNDLGRICEVGSIQVEDLFSVERYQTLHQMTSTVSGTLRPDVGLLELFRSLFPSGSVTGAPKVHTMQIIRELERGRRGVYTGSIGWIAPSGESVFNVAIRTLVIRQGEVRMGVGGGIVADSDPMDEYRECQLKAAFLARSVPEFALIETLRWQREFQLLPLHLDRMESSADYFEFAFDRGSVEEQLNQVQELLRSEKTYRVKMLLNRDAELSIEFSELQDDAGVISDVNAIAVVNAVSVKIARECVSSSDVFLRHKTTHREMYNRHLADARAAGFDDVIFVNERGEVTEGAISNIFIERKGRLLTPPLSSGVLPGVLRRHLLATCTKLETRSELETRTKLEMCREAAEEVLRVEDLQTADAIFLCSALRGLRRVERVEW